MKKSFIVFPGRGVFSSERTQSKCLDRSAHDEYIKTSDFYPGGEDFDKLMDMYTQPIEFKSVDDLDPDFRKELEEDWGLESEPVEYYFLASPGYYGYGEYGSEDSMYFIKLEDGGYVGISEYTGYEEFENGSKMLKVIKSMRRSMLKELKKLEQDLEY